MKNLSKVLALVLVVAMVLSFAVSANAAPGYKDDASIKYTEAVDLLSALKVINGYTDGTFKPTGSITRGEFAVMVSYMVANSNSETPLYDDIYKLGSDYKPLCTFADTKNHWAAGYVAFCAGNGYISGRSADVFDPDATITAAEISVILLRVMGYNAKQENFGTTAGTTKGYNTQITARNAGLLKDLDNIDFFKAANREQTAQLMFNALNANVVNYGLNNDFSLILTDSNGNTTTVSLGGNVHVLNGVTLMNYCFRNVHLDETVTDIYGRTGHQWYADTDGRRANLTDIYFTDSKVAEFIGGTPYSKIASTLGITAASVVKTTEVYVNGKLAGNDQGFVSGYPQLPYNLLEVYRANGALPDNCRMVVTRANDRSQEGTAYKILYYYEMIAKVIDIAQVNVKNDPHFGKYMYTFKYWYGYDTNTDKFKLGYVFDDSDKAFNKNDYYLVEPNDSGVLQPAANIEVTEDYQDFLSIKVAKTEAPVTFTSGSSAKFAYINDTVVGGMLSDGKTTYGVSGYAHDFVNKADYKKALTIVYSSAGYIIGFAPYRAAGNVDEVGYVYIESLEFSSVVNAGSNLITPSPYTRSIQAMALGYFPTTAGNSTGKPIDLEIVDTGAYWLIEVAKANNGVDVTGQLFIEQDLDADGLIDGIQVPYVTTLAYDDGYGQFYFNQPGKVRVYDVTYDGWYYFQKYKNGKYSLLPVSDDEVTTARLNPNVTGLKVGGAAVSGYTLTSATQDAVYSYDVSTHTAKVSVVNAYKDMAPGLHGGLYPDKDLVTGATIVPYTGKVGGIITLADQTKTIPYIDEFTVITPSNTLSLSLYKGVAEWNATRGQYALKFLGNGKAVTLLVAKQVNFDGSVINGTELKDKLVTDGSKGYSLALNENGDIIAVKSYDQTKAEGVFYVDKDGYIRLTSADPAVNYSTTQVWNFYNGLAETITAKDTLYYADVNADGTIDVIWVDHGAGVAVYDPRWTTFPPVVTPWIWWTTSH